MPTKIEWCDETWSPVTGCTKVSPGCDNCYALRMSWRLANHPKAAVADRYKRTVSRPARGLTARWTGEVRCHPDLLDKPLHWRKPRNIFVCSMADLFHEDVPFEFIGRVWASMGRSEQHTFQVLTKWADRMCEFIEMLDRLSFDGFGSLIATKWFGSDAEHFRWPLPNVWLGATIENQDYMTRRYPLKIEMAPVRFLSLEPLLGPIMLHYLPAISWVIVGGESGPKRRECKLEWVRDIVAQCRAANVPVFVKQLHIAGQLVKDIEKFPKDLRIREYPAVGRVAEEAAS